MHHSVRVARRFRSVVVIASAMCLIGVVVPAEARAEGPAQQHLTALQRVDDRTHQRFQLLNWQDMWETSPTRRATA